MKYRFTVDFVFEVPDEATASIVEEALDQGKALLREAAVALTKHVSLERPGIPGVFVGLPEEVTWDSHRVDWVAVKPAEPPR